MNDYPNCTIEHAEFSQDRRVPTATVRLEVSGSSVAILDVYIGLDGHRLYVQNSAHCSVQSLIQWAAWLAANERWLIEEIERKASIARLYHSATEK